MNAIIAPLNDNQIVIYGGSNGHSMYSDAYILDINPESKLSKINNVNVRKGEKNTTCNLSGPRVMLKQFQMAAN